MSELKFGVRLPNLVSSDMPNYEQADWTLIRDVALESEKLGYDFVYINDHLIRPGAILECWTIISAISATTKKVRLRQNVINNLIRHPAVLAKMAATLDFISGGRLEFGIGAGWAEDELLAYGVPFPNYKERVERLEEAVQIIKRMWTMEKASYEGQYYKIKNAVCEPKPVQEPHPPITIGGGGKLTLKVVAKYADLWDHHPPPTKKGLALYKEKFDMLKKYCSRIGRDFTEIEKSWGWKIFTYSDREELKNNFAKWKPKLRVSLEEFETQNIVGTPESCMEIIQEYINIGVTCFPLRFIDLPSRRSLKLFAEKVIHRI